MANKNELINNFRCKFEKMSTKEKNEYLVTMGFSFEESEEKVCCHRLIIKNGNVPIKVAVKVDDRKEIVLDKIKSTEDSQIKCEAQPRIELPKGIQKKRGFGQYNKVRLKFD